MSEELNKEPGKEKESNSRESAGKSLFREESLQRVYSPEKTNGYVRLPTPSRWLPVSAAAALIVGAVSFLLVYFR